MVTRPEIEKIVRRLVDLIRSRYVFPEVGEEICAAIELKLGAGEYAKMDSYAKLSEMLTADLQSINQDKHLRVQVV